MNKYFFKAIWIAIIFVASFIFNGCNDDSDEPQGPFSSNMVCTKWGTSKSEVMDYMRNHEINTMENGFICYNGKNNVRTISYQFQDEELSTSLVLIPQDMTSLPELQSSFNNYEYLGEKNGTDIYISETTNTMAIITQKVKGETTYYAIGYTVLDTETSH